MKYLISACLCLFSMNSWAWSECSTHEICTAENNCQCLIPADWVYNRYYYVDFSQLQKGHRYQCNLMDSYQMSRLDLADSQFPSGLTYEMSTPSMNFPVSLCVDTTDMENSSDTMILKFSVAPSDQPTQLTVNCTMQN
jgi:hypothetical protein